MPQNILELTSSQKDAIWQHKMHDYTTNLIQLVASYDVKCQYVYMKYI